MGTGPLDWPTTLAHSLVVDLSIGPIFWMRFPFCLNSQPIGRLRRKVNAPIFPSNIFPSLLDLWPFAILCLSAVGAPIGMRPFPFWPFGHLSSFSPFQMDFSMSEFNCPLHRHFASIPGPSLNFGFSTNGPNSFYSFWCPQFVVPFSIPDFVLPFNPKIIIINWHYWLKITKDWMAKCVQGGGWSECWLAVLLFRSVFPNPRLFNPFCLLVALLFANPSNVFGHVSSLICPLSLPLLQCHFQCRPHSSLWPRSSPQCLGIGLFRRQSTPLHSLLPEFSFPHQIHAFWPTIPVQAKSISRRAKTIGQNEGWHNLNIPLHLPSNKFVTFILIWWVIGLEGIWVGQSSIHPFQCPKIGWPPFPPSFFFSFCGQPALFLSVHPQMQISIPPSQAIVLPKRSLCYCPSISLNFIQIRANCCLPIHF